MFRITLRGLFAHKLRFLLTAVAVVLGVAFVSGTLIFTDTVRQTFDRLFANAYAGTDAYVRNHNEIQSDFGPPQRERISESFIAQVSRVDGVAADDGDLRIPRAQFLDGRGKLVGNPGQGPPAFGFNWVRVPRLNPYTLVRYGGRASHAPTAVGEVVIDKGTADGQHFGIGHRVAIQFNNAKIPQETFTVVGVVKFGDADSRGSGTVALFTLAETQRLNGTPGMLDGVAAAATPGLSQGELVHRIRVAIPARKVQVITGATLIKETQDRIQKSLSFFGTALLIFALVSLFVGAFIIVNTFSIVIAQRTRELALLRALGATGRQVRASILVEALIVGLVASAIGIGAGLGLALALRALMAAFGFTLPTTDLVVKPSTFVFSLGIGVVVTFFSAVFPARRAARIPPMAALRSVALEARNLGRRTAIGAMITLLGAGAMAMGLFGGAGIALVGIGMLTLFVGVAVLGPVIARPVGRALGAPLPRWRGTAGLLARENAVRNPRRTASTAAALMIGVALVGLITIFASSLSESIGGQIDRAFRGDLIVMGESGFGAGFSPAVAAEIRKIPGIAVTNPMRFAGFEIGGSGKGLAAANPSDLVKVFDMSPRGGDLGSLGPNQIAVSTQALKDHHWKLGQTIAAKFPVGGVDHLKIGAVYGFGQREGFIDYLISLTAFDQRFTEIADNQITIGLARGTTAKSVTPEIKRVLKRFPGTQLNDRSGLKDQVQSQINQLIGMVFALLFLAILIAVLGIMNTLLLSIVERTREIGLLRAVGMTRRQVRTAVRWEAIIVAVFGALLGLIIGVVFGWAVVRALRDQGFTDFAVPVGQLVVIVVVAGLAGVLAAAYPARRASRFNILDAISAE